MQTAPDMPADCLYADTPELLEEAVSRLKGEPWLCVDTEFMREKTYYPQLCLLQVASPDFIACVDPLAVGDLKPLLDVLYDPTVIKVFHAASQDLEILYHLGGQVPGPIFDTQVAAAVLFHSDQIGYAALVERMLGIQIDKSQTRTDWSLRPLDPEQLQYAADDVRHLREIYVRQLQVLREQNRLHWLDEDFIELTDPRRYASAPDEIWRRVKDARRLKSQQLAVLRALAAWREQRAMRLDKPRKWILRDEVLTELARIAPTGLEAMAKVRGLEKGLLERHGRELLSVIGEARQVPREQWPELEPRIVLTPGQEALVDAMMALVRLRAAQQDLSPAMLAGRKTLELMVTGNRDVDVLHGWRRAIVGSDLEALLTGKCRLSVDAGVLTVHRGEAEEDERVV